MPCKYGKRTREHLAPFDLYFSLVFLYLGALFNKLIAPLALAGYEMIIANSALYASLAIGRSWNNC